MIRHDFYTQLQTQVRVMAETLKVLHYYYWTSITQIEIKIFFIFHFLGVLPKSVTDFCSVACESQTALSCVHTAQFDQLSASLEASLQ